VGLYLHDCSLADISSDLLAPLNSTLRYLWLNGNELERLDVSLATSFAPLHHLRLGSNPLCCDCSAAWLRSFFDEHADAFRGALPPSCFRPLRLRGRPLADVERADLRCRPPSFTALQVRFDTGARRPRLFCAAVGDPSPTVYWIQPSGRTTRYERPTRDGASDVEHVEAVLELMSGSVDHDGDASMAGLYTCIANNNIGNVTMTVVIPAQASPPPVFRHNSEHLLPPRGATDPTTLTAIATPPVVTTPAILQSILLGDSLLQLQRLSASSDASPPPPYSLIGSASYRNRSSGNVAQHDMSPISSNHARWVSRFRLSML